MRRKMSFNSFDKAYDNYKDATDSYINAIEAYYESEIRKYQWALVISSFVIIFLLVLIYFK